MNTKMNTKFVNEQTPRFKVFCDHCKTYIGDEPYFSFVVDTLKDKYVVVTVSFGRTRKAFLKKRTGKKEVIRVEDAITILTDESTTVHFGGVVSRVPDKYGLGTERRDFISRNGEEVLRFMIKYSANYETTKNMGMRTYRRKANVIRAIKDKDKYEDKEKLLKDDFQEKSTIAYLQTLTKRDDNDNDNSYDDDDIGVVFSNNKDESDESDESNE